jgi:hypothetical protein
MPLFFGSMAISQQAAFAETRERTPIRPVHKKKGVKMHLRSGSAAGFVAVALFLSLCSQGYSAEYFKWTDEAGELHISDSLSNVPAKYRRGIESRQVEVSKPSATMPPGARPFVQQALVAGGEEKPLKKYEVAYTPNEGSAKRVIISARFNGSVTAPIAIDTGAPGTIISFSLAEKLGLFDEDHGRLLISTGGIGGSAPAVRSIIDTVEVGGAMNTFVPVTIIKPISDSFDGLLGMDFFSNYSVTIDTKRKVVIFEELPLDPDHPGGHDREWWTTLFKEFATSRARWKAYGEALDKKIHDSMRSTGNEDSKWKEFADDQYREADKLFDKLNRYAREHSVPMHWKQY